LQAFLAGGLKVYDGVFEGRYIPALQSAGGHIVNVLNQFRYINPKHGALMRNYQAKEPVIAAFCSRHLLETTARALVTSNTRVTFQYGTTAAGLLFQANSSNNDSNNDHNSNGNDWTRSSSSNASHCVSTSSSRSSSGSRRCAEAAVAGVLLSDGSTLAADLVVDCSGRFSALPDWLEAAGYDRPRTSHVSANCGYACW
jgi:hypothetical protein